MGSSFYPLFEFTVGGKPLLDKAQLGTALRQVRVCDAIGRLDEVTVGFRWTKDADDKVKALQAHGKEFVLTINKATKPGSWSKSREICGDIMEVEYRHDKYEDVIVLRGLSAMHRLKTSFQAVVYEKKKQNDVVMGTVKAAGLTAQADGTAGTAQNYIQGGQSDASFLDRLMRDNPSFVMRAEKKKLKFVRGKSVGEGGKVEVPWDKVRELRLRHSLDGVVASVKAIGYDPVKAEKVEGVAKDSDLEGITSTTNAASLAKKAKIGTELVLHNLSTAQATQCKEIAKAELQRRANNFVSGTIEVDFLPEARSGATLTVTGNDAPWPVAKAKLRIREVTHEYRIGDAARTILEVYSDSLPA